MSENTIPPVGQQRLVRLCRCAKTSCRHLYPEDEAERRPTGRNRWSKHCPKCGCKTFYCEAADGSRPKLPAWEASPWPPEANDQVEARRK